MDTKSKNRHSLGIIIILVIILLASMATVGLYPYMVQRAEEYKASNDERRKENYASNVMDELALQVMNSCYQAWREQAQEEAGKILTPSQVFLPELDEKLREVRAEEYGIAVQNDSDETAVVQEDSLQYDTGFYENLKVMMDGIGDDWQGYSQVYANRLKYKMEDESGKLLRSNASDPAWEFKNIEQDEMIFQVHFTASGTLKLGAMSGVSNPDRLQQALGFYEFYDPLAKRMGADYRYSGVEFSGPKNVTYQFKCSPSAFYGDRLKYMDGNLDGYDIIQGGTLYMVVFSICAVILILALALPAVKSLEIGRSALCRVSFEPVCMLGTLWLMMLGEGSIPGAMIVGTHYGALQSELERTHMAVPVAVVLAVVLNILFWMAVYGMFYWGITCLRAVFSLGLWRYIKERTWAGRFCCFVKRWVCRCLNPFNETDWHSHSSRAIGKAVIANFIILAVISCLWFFGIGALIIYSFVLFFMISKYWKQMEQKYNRLLEAINQMAEGELDVEVTEDLGLFNPLKEQLGRVRQGFKKAVNQELKSERTKAELITNVSHDLKTPLTAIITYVNLLKQPGVTEEERDSYIQVLDQKSMRLKVLIEDLFEVSKASSGAVTLHREPVDIVSLIKQVKLELYDRLEASGVNFRWNLPEEKVVLYLDSQRTYRIFENLLVNIAKYAMPGTRAYVDLTVDSHNVTVIMRNISARELTVSPEELTERFVRGDTARNTEGSGLGLAIARSFTELQDGTMEVSIEGDLFRVIICWKLMTEEPDSREKKDKPSPDTGENREVPAPEMYREPEQDSHVADYETPGGGHGSIRNIMRHNTGKTDQRLFGVSKRKISREMEKAKAEEAKRELARAKESQKEWEKTQAENADEDEEWDFKQDESWNAVLDDGEGEGKQ